MRRHIVWTLAFLMLSWLLGFFSVSLAEEGKWTKKADMLTRRMWLSTSTVNGKIYAIGGTGRGWVVEEYDPITDTWTWKARMPTEREGLSTSAVNGKIYAIGGWGGHARPIVEEYDPKTDTWTKKADMPGARWALSSSEVGGKIYAIGGSNAFGPGISMVQKYDPATNTWTNKADMPTKRMWLSTSAVNGKIYAIGGWSGDHILSTVEEYDPRTDTWTRKSNMPTARCCLSTSVVDGKIYAIGGSTGFGRGDILMEAGIPVVEEYDPATNTWSRKSDMPTARGGLSASAVNGKIYAIGGFNGVSLSAVEEYDPEFAGLGIEAKEKLPISWGKIKSSWGIFILRHPVTILYRRRPK